MSFHDVMFSGVERRKEALEEAAAAGRLGATRLPLALASDPTLSETFIGKLTLALEEGHEQRMRDHKFRAWMTTHSDRLEAMLIEVQPCNSDEWLRQQYIIETGEQP